MLSVRNLRKRSLENSTPNKQSAIQSPKSFQALSMSPRNQDAFTKLEKVKQSCEEFKKELNNIYKITSKKFENDIAKCKRISLISNEEEKFWKKDLLLYKKSKNKDNKKLQELKSLSSHEFIVKEPIKRQYFKQNIILPQRQRISISDVVSLTGKKILSGSKRKFGEILSIKEVEKNEYKKEKTKPNLQICEKIQSFPNLAQKIKNFKDKKQ